MTDSEAVGKAQFYERKRENRRAPASQQKAGGARTGRLFASAGTKGRSKQFEHRAKMRRYWAKYERKRSDRGEAAKPWLRSRNARG